MTIADQITKLKQDFDEVKQAGYNEGFEAGKSEGGDTNAAYRQGVAYGKQAEYDAFWDGYQNQGLSSLRKYQFYNWNADVFRPKYNLVANTNADVSYAFHGMTSEKSYEAGDIMGRFDFAALLEELGITLNTGNAFNVSYCFANSSITHLPKIDLSKATSTTAMCANCPVVTIDELVCSEKTKFGSSMISTGTLVNLTITGIIAQSGLTLSNCTKLTRTSIESVISALSPNTSGLSVTLSLTAVKNAFGEDAQTEGSAWDLYKQENCPNWTIALK